ncbi:proline-rich protein 36-like [Leopardus geoffroyi]|uniref:proline-rich protein 36-like n=1 Tax=Leopardus geoffroyi TaxID=46844 RepID=UPI001E25E2F8|nr:proline-rich protein 36-like [Leopardus geoffroyi]
MRGGRARGRRDARRMRPSLGRCPRPFFFFFFSRQVIGGFFFPLAPPTLPPLPSGALSWRPRGHNRRVAGWSALRTWRRRQWQLMELSRNSAEETRKRTGLGRCRHFFWLGVAFDTVGATVLFTGVFARLVFSDLLLYLGSIIIFLSLLWWVFWYTGNIELTAEEPSKRPFHVLSSTMVDALSHTVSHRFSLTICNVSRNLRGFRRRCSRRRFLQTVASLDMTVTGQLENRLEKEDEDKDATQSVQESGDAQDLRGEDLGPKPEPVGSSEGVRSPGPGAGLPGFVKGSSSTHLGPPEFVVSPPDRPRAPAVLPFRSQHGVPWASARQPPAVRSLRIQPAVSLATAGQPAASLASGSQAAPILASKSLPAAPSTSMSQPGLVPASQSQSLVSLPTQSQPLVPMATQSHLLVPVASQGHPLVPAPAQSNLQALLASQSYRLLSAASQSHLQAPLASQSQTENLSLVSETTSPVAVAPQAQALSTPVSVIQLLSSQSFQNQTVDLRLSLAVPDFQDLCHTQQDPQSIMSLVREMTPSQMTPSQSASAQEFQKPVAQASETPLPASQELSQDPPATTSPPPGSQAQQSVPPENTPVPASEMRSHPP